MGEMLTGTLRGNVITLDAAYPTRQDHERRRVQVTIEPLPAKSSEGDASAISRQRNERIEALYAEVRQLAKQQEEPAARELVRDRVAELRKLQQLEAEAMRRRFASRQSFPQGAGLEALENSRRLLGDDADPAAADGSTVSAD